MMARRREVFPLVSLLISVHVSAVGSFTCLPAFSNKTFQRILRAKPLKTNEDDANRRQVLLSALSTTLLLSQFPQPSNAGEVGARITKAVTTSDLGIAVRESVVRGAQTMDKLDGQWEQFSDKFGLGAARKQQPQKPAPKDIPEPLPLDTELAKRILETSDRIFTSLTGISQSSLAQQVQTVADKVRPSFERTGVSLQDGSAQAFNFDSYCRFKAYCDLLLTDKVPFNTFRRNFEDQMGQQLLTLLLPQYYNKSSSTKRDNLEATLQQRLSLIDKVCQILVEKGLVAATERSTLDDDQIPDWSNDLSDLTFTIALDGDITQNCQILLQEQGFRLYPNYAKYVIAKLLELPQQTVAIDEYYLDTDYNSDPNRFVVKEVMLNIVLDSAS